MDNFFRNHYKSYLKKVLLNNSGIFLIEVTVSLGIAGILMLSLLAMMQLVNQNGSRVSLGVTKNELVNRIRQNAISLLVLESSANMTLSLGSAGLTPDIGTPNNLVNYNKFADCLPTVASPGSCDKSSMDDARGFRFYLSYGNSTDPLKAVAGEDVYYTFTGVRCDQIKAATPSDCPIMAQAWAEPFCSNFATTCTKAISLTVRYRLSLRPDFTGTALMSPLEGEVYVPLTKGIQLSRVLNENDVPFTLNNNGIYSIQKYYYDINPTQPKGLRFEAILGNPTGLQSMKLQYRAITGTEANSYLDDTIPDTLSSKAWLDVPTELSSTANDWSVNLSGAKSNQIINFGTQNSATPANLNRYYKLGAASLDSQTEKDKHRWSLNALNEFIEPTYKSGIYQFKVVARDSNGNDMDSMNYITIRIVSHPQFLLSYSAQPNVSQTRNCISAQKDITYKVGIVDDEGLGAQTLKLNGTDYSFTAINSNKGFVDITFDLSKTATTYNYVMTAANKFLNKTVNNSLIAANQNTLSVTLSEMPVGIQSLASNPSKIRITETGAVTATFEAGSCCNLTPTVSWSYPLVPTSPLLSGSTSSTPSCSIDTTENKKICTATVSAKGEKETPTGYASTSDIVSTFSFSSGSNACTGGSTTTSYQKSAAIPVIKLPGIQFYTSESLWLTLPSNSKSGFTYIKTFTPKVRVRIDFDPSEDVTIGIYKPDSTLACPQITFSAGTGTIPVDKECNIPGGYSGDLVLKRVTSNILLDGENSMDPLYKAKLVSGKLNHRTCQPNLVSGSDFGTLNVSTTQEMKESPWGLASPYNDQSWVSDSQKNFRCYDQWSGSNSAVYSGVTKSYAYDNKDLLNIVGYGTSIDVNVQDPYLLHRYNTEKALRPTTSSPVAHTKLGTSESGRARFQTYQFPIVDGNIDYSAKNAPYVFVVWNNGSINSASMENLAPNGNTTTLTSRAWQDYTGTFCSGNAALSTIRLYGMRAYGGSISGTTTYAVNNIYTGTATSFDSSKPNFYSYHFMCSYGQWNPLTRSGADWTD